MRRIFSDRRLPSLVALLALIGPTASLAAETGTQADRTRELLEYACSSALGAHRLTLFANGTLRLWEGLDEERRMSLAELNQDELASYIERLSMLPFNRPGEGPARGPTGELVEQCLLEVELDGFQPLSYRFSRLEGHALDLANRLVIADELLVEARTRSLGSAFPPDYRPKVGDVLRHRDGPRYRIDAFTSDGRGVEVSGIDTPLLFYIALEAITSEFVGVESRTRDR